VVATYVLRLSPENAKRYEPALDELEERLEEMNIGEVSGKVSMAGMEVVFFIDLLSDLDKPRLVKLLIELQLREVARLEEAEEADDDDWDDDDSDDWDDDAEVNTSDDTEEDPLDPTDDEEEREDDDEEEDDKE